MSTYCRLVFTEVNDKDSTTRAQSLPDELRCPFISKKIPQPLSDTYFFKPNNFQKLISTWKFKPPLDCVRMHLFIWHDPDVAVRVTVQIVLALIAGFCSKNIDQKRPGDLSHSVTVLSVPSSHNITTMEWCLNKTFINSDKLKAANSSSCHLPIIPSVTWLAHRSPFWMHGLFPSQVWAGRWVTEAARAHVREEGGQDSAEAIQGCIPLHPLTLQP